MANPLEQAIDCNDGEHATKIIQHEASRRCRSLMRPTGERLWAKRRSHRCLGFAYSSGDASEAPFFLS
jgi:hypothetical protein